MSADRDALRDKIEDRLGHHPDCSRLDSRFDDDCDCGTWTRIVVVMEEIDSFAEQVRRDALAPVLALCDLYDVQTPPLTIYGSEIARDFRRAAGVGQDRACNCDYPQIMTPETDHALWCASRRGVGQDPEETP